MKKIILAALVMLTSVAAMAQMPQFTPEDMATRQATQIKEACKINDDQYKAIYTYLLDQSKKMMAQMDSIRNAGGNGGRGAFNREAMQKRQEEQTAKIKSILTPEQFTAYEEMLKKQRERRGQFGGGRPRQ